MNEKREARDTGLYESLIRIYRSRVQPRFRSSCRRRGAELPRETQSSSSLPPSPPRCRVDTYVAYDRSRAREKKKTIRELGTSELIENPPIGSARSKERDDVLLSLSRARESSVGTVFPCVFREIRREKSNAKNSRAVKWEGGGGLSPLFRLFFSSFLSFSL